MVFPALELRLPRWVESLVASRQAVYPTREERMQLAVELARDNVRQGTGGPFGAALFTLPEGRLVAPGVNLVVAAACSVFHAELVAIMLAQRLLSRYDLGAGDRSPCTLAASAEPCAMCYGAVPWAGIRELVCGAREEDVRSAGFDEGEKPADWAGALERRGIRVVRDIHRREAAAVLRHYAKTGGPIYHPGGPSQTGGNHS